MKCDKCKKETMFLVQIKLPKYYFIKENYAVCSDCFNDLVERNKEKKK